jgi:methionyl-tRNA formyltransferase
VRILFAGTPAVAIPTLNKLLSSEHEVVAVVTTPPAPAGRGQKLLSTEVADAGRAAGLQVFEFADINSPDSIRELVNLNVDVAVVVAYGQLLKQEVLLISPNGWINLHFSLLPMWRGAAPVQHAILSGDEVTGATTFLLETGMDTGPIIGQLTTDINPTETAGELLERLSVEGADLMLTTIDAIAKGEAGLVPQANIDVSYAPKISVSDAEIDWKHPALAISRKVRAFNPAPHAWTVLGDNKLLINAVAFGEFEEVLKPGQIHVSKNQVLVGTGSVALELLEVKPAGKNWMPAADWARGIRPAVWAFNV